MLPYNDKYLNKYVKYKNKYLKLYNNLKGGAHLAMQDPQGKGGAHLAMQDPQGKGGAHLDPQGKANTDYKIIVLNFCINRQFVDNPSFSGTKILDVSAEEFSCKINNMLKANSIKLTPGALYSFAPHIFIDKKTLDDNGLNLNLLLNDIPIEGLESLIKSNYVSRNETEIKILTRWIDKKDVEPSKIPVFNFIDIVLYTKEHLLKEINERIEKKTNSDADLIDKQKLEDPSITHGIVKIIAMSEEKETPIDPITMIRNHLGMEFGGNGEKINLVKYQESVNYWSRHVLLK